ALLRQGGKVTQSLLKCKKPPETRRTKRKPLKHRKPHTKPKLTAAQKEAIYALPLGKQFRIVHIDAGSGFAVYRHVLVDALIHKLPLGRRR
ncbi:MAG: hypothetical protein NC324_10955, partial [Bacteroides sp.]|nr:hypothetical protein [Bacteroides sp.]